MQNEILKILEKYDKKKINEYIQFIVQGISDNLMTKGINHQVIDDNKIIVLESFSNYIGNTMIEIHLYMYNSGLRKHLTTRSKNFDLIAKLFECDFRVDNYVFLSTFGVEDLSDLYKDRYEMIKNHFVGKSIYYENIFSFEERIASLSDIDIVSHKTIVVSASMDLPHRREIRSNRLIRDYAIASAVKIHHQHECQVCGYRLPVSSSSFYSEAHHLQPLGGSHKGPDTITNLLVVCPNHHVQCDKGAIGIVKSKLKGLDYHKIDDSYIDYHNDVIYRGGR